MSNIAVSSDYINRQMDLWYEREFDSVVIDLSRLCGCRSSRLLYQEYNPSVNSRKDAGFIFYAPDGESKIAEIRWRRDGRCTNLLYYPDVIEDVHKQIVFENVQRARTRSVQQAIDESKKNGMPYQKGTREYNNAIKKKIVNKALAVALVVSMGISFFGIKDALNRDYVNDSYNSGYKAVAVETFRTQDNEHYWHDYGDIAERYDAETMDFDSYVYGTFKNLGWNEQSRLDCMESLFRQFNLQGITSFSSFKSYCASKGAVVEKNGETRIDIKEFCNAMEEYMTNLNQENSLDEDKGLGR